ncbi:FK506-binding protein 15-like isoform X2 [Convolutriloba macropyga]|uniref:FK506-binding protein 15-like isoform X2 n=1 Tax=Convolutriloba macropyga TaxID=536237 RepID=UPI003F52317E
MLESEESDLDFTSTKKNQKSGNKLADLFSDKGAATGTAANGKLNSTVSFKYKSSPNSSRKGSVRSVDESADTNMSIIYQETVHLFQYQDNKHIPKGAVGIAILIDPNTKAFNLIVYQSKQNTLVNIPVDSNLTVTPQKDKYVCFYDQRRQLWYLLFSEDSKLVSFCMHVFTCKCSSASKSESAIQILDVITSAEKEVVQSGTKAQIRYTAYLVDGSGKLGKAFDSNSKESAKVLTVDLKSTNTSVIKGIKEGVVGMRKQSTRIVFIPPKLGYGKTGVKGRVPPDSHLVYEIKVVKIVDEPAKLSKKNSTDSSKGAVPLPKLPPPTSNNNDEDEDEEEESSGTNDDDETEGPAESGNESSTTTTNEEQSNSKSLSVTRAKLIQKTAKLGQSILPPMNNNTSKVSKSHSVRVSSNHQVGFYSDGKTANTRQDPTGALPEMAMPGAMIPNSAANTSNQIALYNPALNAQPAHSTSMYPPYNPSPLSNPYQPQAMASPASAMMPATIYAQPQNPAATGLLQQTTPFGATMSLTTPTVSSGIDQSTASNLQLVMLESKQVQNDLRTHVMQVSSKLDQVQQKVDVLASRDTPFGTGASQVSMEAAVLMQNIHRVVQENDRLKRETDEARVTIDGQTEKIASLLSQNQKYLEQSNIMLEQRNESFQSVSSASQIKITQLEQEKTQMLNELNSLNNKIAELQFDLSTQKQRQVDFKAQISEEALGKNQMREELATSKNKITELEEDVGKLKQAYREQRASRKAAEAKVGELEEQLTDSTAEMDSLNRQIGERKRRADADKQLQEKEMDDLRKLHESELESWKLRVEQQRKQGSEASLALSRLESELESQWRLKCDHMVQQTRDQMELQVKDANARSDTLQSEISRVKSTVSELESQLSKSQRELQVKQSSLSRKEWQCTQFESNIYRLEEDLAKASKIVSPEVLLPEVKKIMNMIFQVLVKHINREAHYTGDSLLQFMKIVIKDVTLSVSSGQQPKALTGSEVLIEPVPPPEAAEEDEDEETESEEGSDEIDDNKEENINENTDDAPSIVIVETRYELPRAEMSIKSEVREAAPEPELQLIEAEPSTSPANRVEQNQKPEYGATAPATVTEEPLAQAQTSTQIITNGDTEDLMSTGSFEDLNQSNAVLAEDGFPPEQEQENKETSSVHEVPDPLEEELAAENSDPEDAIVLDPRNIPSPDLEERSEVESRQGDAYSEEPLNTEEQSSEPEGADTAESTAEADRSFLEVPESTLVAADRSSQFEVSSTEGESVLNPLSVGVQNGVVPELESHEDAAVETATEPTVSDGKTDIQTVESEPQIEKSASEAVHEQRNEQSQSPVFNNTPPPLPSSPPEVPHENAPEDPLERSSLLEQDRVIGGGSLPALRPNSPPSSLEESDQGEDPLTVPPVNDGTPTTEDSGVKSEQGVMANSEKQEEEFDDVEAELNEVLQKDSSAAAVRSDRIFDDSDSDDSLFGSKAATSTTKKTETKSGSQSNVSASKEQGSGVKKSEETSATKKNVSLFPSDDEDEELDWLK